VDAESSAGPASTQVGIEIESAELEEKLRSVKDSLEDYAAREEFGKFLFERFFAGPVNDRWKQCRGRLEGAASTMRLRLRVEDEELAAWPWELLREDDFLATSRTIWVSRYMPVGEPYAFITSEKVRVLLIVQNPPELPVQSELLDRLRMAFANLEPKYEKPRELTNTEVYDINQELLKAYEAVHYVVKEVIRRLKKPVEIHCPQHFGLGVANTIAALCRGRACTPLWMNIASIASGCACIFW
jgi:hypothetical protein